ncbi:RNA-binding GTPase [Saccharomycopsis crataegensis]|uniref:RNA-binding GTPase n=1 Tax=Saccharomycopsis crataegensis TaxID=43959 RepID=A0AAV5QQN9_9ASCO|nr:RNA-binding GTPase [Saccharomycopsis crataegensis]
MRVRKPTSKRTSTRMREGIKKKSAAHRRKEAKLAKKNPQWKSRKPKDPGIPSTFPYKEEILQEIEAKRLAQVEEKERRKAEKAAERQQADNNNDNDDQMEIDDDEEQQQGNGLVALVESAQQAAREFDGEVAANDQGMDEDDEEGVEYVDLDLEELVGGDDNELEDDDEFEFYKNNDDSEKSLKAFNRFFKAVVDVSDVVLYVLDARDPEGTRSKKVEEAVLQSKDKKLILLLNKVDLVPTEVMEKWMDYYKRRFPIIPFKGSSSAATAVAHSFNKNLSQSVTATALLTSLKGYANKSDLKRSIVVGVVGFPNVGKSSIINALTSKHGGSSKACPTGNAPGVTTTLREVKVDNKLKIVDSPGIVFPPPVSENKKKHAGSLKKLKMQQEAKLALLNALPNKLLKDPTMAIQLLIRRVKRNEATYETFKAYYEMPPLPEHDIEELTKQVLIHIARVRGRLGKGGVPNFHSAAMSILNDWKDGRFVGWTEPPEKPLETQMSANTIKVNGKVDQVTVVQQWSKEFDLDGLFASVGMTE